MRKPSYRIIVAVAIALVVAACSSNSEPASPDTSVASTTQATTTTTTQATTTTEAPTTTTTEAPVTVDPDALLGSVNDAMADQESFLGIGSLSMTDADDDATEYVNAELRGGQSSPDNSWIVSIMDVASGDFAGSLQWELREVNAVRYEQNPVSGEWRIDEDPSSNPVRDTLNGALTLADTTADEIPGGYRITGTYPGDPTVELVELEVSADDLLVRRLVTRARDPRADAAAIIPEGDSDIITTNAWNFDDYGIDIAPTFAPPQGTATAITRFSGGTFAIQIPTEWTEASTEEVIASGTGVDRIWSSDDGIVMPVITDDLIEKGIGTTTLEDYVDIITTGALADAVIDDTIMTVNGQGEPIAILRGTSDETGQVRFVRLITVRDGTIAFNVTIVGDTDVYGENRDAILFLLNSLLINT